jgi:hypothetical protein
LPQELRLAAITTVEAANRFLRERYLDEFNARFTVKAAERGTAFRRCGRSDLDWIFSIQTERVVSKDNTVAIRDQWWQLDKTRWRHTLAGQTVTIHQHLDGTVSIRYGPHVEKTLPWKTTHRFPTAAWIRSGPTFPPPRRRSILSLPNQRRRG